MGRARSLVARAAASGPGQWVLDHGCAIRDSVDRATGRADPLVPPTRMMFDGPRGVKAYRENGREFLAHFRSLGGLKPEEDVLDVGSGIGRKAMPLTGFLLPTSRYEGFDINTSGVEWCRAHISARFPNFHFQPADVYNAHYNPDGATAASEYVFPFDDESFDFVFLGSVFTHLVPADLDNYVAQIARVLRPGGRMLATFFLLDDVTEAQTRAGRAFYDFRFECPGHRVFDPKDPEYAVAYATNDMFEIVRSHGLDVSDDTVYLGSWSGRPYGLSFQDIVVATKPGRG
jgi:SAM-dependent methyltransferase